ncbi:hypothetical protein A3D23_07565 [candidate division WOR-1 bacterium RIFCSPHIGHO2_02_FULL_53_26]|nr:MAG: hypothetical protein A3D23_07565 [candidate division WOR-1 bacterium RIFCSPHIGHO2_02_FULL_53_26]
MMEPVFPIDPTIAAGRMARLPSAAGTARSAKVTEEFLTIFYKEMLKTAIKSPDLTFGDEEEKEKNSVFYSLNQDVMIEQFAHQLAKDQMERPGWLPAPGAAK